MLLEFRQTHEANKMEVANDEVQEDPTEHQQTSDDILQRIEKLQKGANSIQIALSRFVRHAFAPNFLHEPSGELTCV